MSKFSLIQKVTFDTKKYMSQITRKCALCHVQTAKTHTPVYAFAKLIKHHPQDPKTMCEQQRLNAQADQSSMSTHGIRQLLISFS